MPVLGITFRVEENLHFTLNKKTVVKNWLKKVAKQEGRTTGNISYFFCTDEYLLKLNRQFLNHDTYTDIITFDYSEGSKIQGEIFISVERVRENALKFKQPFEKELMRTIVHGVLHLCGYKDKTATAKKEMRLKEDAALAHSL